MSHNLRLFFLLAFFGLCTDCIIAQESPYNNDFELWFSLQIDKKLNKKWNAAISFADRLEHNAAYQKVAFVEPELSYTINKRMGTSMSLRYAMDPFDKSTEQILISRSSYNYRIKRFKIGYRLRFDHDIGSNELLSSVRNRISIGYSRKKLKLSPKLSYEMISSNKTEGWLYNKWRLRVSTGYKLSKRAKVNLFYMIQRQISEAAPQQDFVLGVGYSYTLRKWKSKGKGKDKKGDGK